MIIKSIKARNFMRYPEIELKGFPQRGVIGIFGNNECGKSTIGHIISFALFGGTIKATKGEKEQIIHWGEEVCEVELEFSWGTKEYKVYRRIRQTGAQIARIEDMSKGKIVATGVHDVEDVIYNLLTFDFKGFRYSTYVGQKELTLIHDASKIKDRKEVINSMLGIDAMEKTRLEIPAKIKLSKTERDGISIEKNNVENTVKELMEKHKESDAIKTQLKSLEDEYKTKSEKLEKLKEDLKVFQKYKEVSTKIASKNEVIVEKRSAINNVIKTLQEIQDSKTKLQKLEKDIEKYATSESELESKKELRKQFISFKNQLDEIKRMANEYRTEVSSQISRYKQQEQGLNDRNKSLERDITEEESIQVDEADIKYLDVQKNKVDKSMWALAVCAIGSLIVLIIMLSTGNRLWFVPLILAIITAVGAYYKITKSKKLAQSLKQYEKDRLRLEQREEHLAKYSDEKMQIAKQTGIANEQISQLAVILQVMKQLSFDSFHDIDGNFKLLRGQNLNPLSEMKNGLSLIISKSYPFINTEQKIIDYELELNKAIDEQSSMAKEKARLDTDIKNNRNIIKKEQDALNLQSQLGQEIKEQHEIVAKLQAELPSIEYSEAEYNKAEKSYSDLEKRVKELEGGRGNSIGRLKTLEKDVLKLPKVQEKLKELEDNYKNKSRELQIYDILNDAFIRNQQEIRKRLGPSIEMYFSWILPKITNNRYQKVKVSEDFNISVYSLEKNDFVDIDNLSGGTEDQLLLSLRLAFAKALTPEGAQFFLFLDEPISSFDEQRRTSFLDFLKLLETNFQQIFIISHLTGLEDFVDNFIRIEDTKGGIPQVSYSWA